MNHSNNEFEAPNASLNKLIETLGVDHDAADAELLAEMKLAAGRALMRRGQVREAARALMAAGNHTQAASLRSAAASELLGLAKAKNASGGGATAEEREQFLRSAFAFAPE